MALESIVWALDQELPANQKLVLIGLANYANHEYTCWPSHKTLMKLSGIRSRQTIIKCLDSLEDRGLISKKGRIKSTGEQTSNSYKLHCKTGVQEMDRGGLKNGQGGVQNLDRGGLKNGHEPVIEPVNNNHKVFYPSEFELFWQEAKKAYSKLGCEIGTKKEAFKQFKKIGIDETWAIALGNTLHAQAANKLAAKERGIFVSPFKNLVRWLSNCCWEDELLVIPQKAARRVVV